MEYLTAAEISKYWNISSRMVAYYCEAGRINGAIKKGKAWLIPLNTKKPVDRRCSKQSNQSKNNLQGKPYKSSGISMDTVYHTGDVYNSLGLTRETLRYYEKIGLIKPKRSQYSQYREFNLLDVSRFMTIDFYKKRGFTPAEIRELQNAATAEEYNEVMQKKIHLLRKNIDDLTEMLDKLEKSKRYFCDITDASLEFTVKELPPYYIQDMRSLVADVDDYRDKILSYLNTEKEDILSNIMRFITFDDNSYKTSGIYVAKPDTGRNQYEHEARLECGKCLYTTLIADDDDTTVPERMFSLCHEWANRHGVSFRGVVYIFSRFVTLNGSNDRYYYEVWVPLKE